MLTMKLYNGITIINVLINKTLLAKYFDRRFFLFIKNLVISKHTQIKNPISHEVKLYCALRLSNFARVAQIILYS